VSDESPWPAAGFPAGARVAGYRLDEQIGRGGMAVVYRAYDLQLDRQVALKILDPVLAEDREFQQRFIRESKAAAAVDHPHIIPVFAAGEADGVLFIAMRYVAGADVRTLLDTEGPLPAWRAVDIAAQVAAALDTAHDRGLVHRDVKPANMLRDRATGPHAEHIYLSDFGLSKKALAAEPITATGQLVGTLDYVAPEQIENRPVDGRADLYALACATWEMLAGTPPFNRDQGVAVLWAQLSEPPPPLTARRPDLPAAVNQVMIRALAKSPGARYQRCADFVRALRTACQPVPGEEHSPGPAPDVPVASASPPAAFGVPTATDVSEPVRAEPPGPLQPVTAPPESPWFETPLRPGEPAPDPLAQPAYPVTDPGDPVWAGPPRAAEPAPGPAPPAWPDPAESAWPDPAQPAWPDPALPPAHPATDPGDPVWAGPPRAAEPAANPAQSGWVEPPPRAAEPPTGPLPPVTGPPSGGSAGTGPRWRSRMVPALIGLLILGVAGTGLAVARSRHHTPAPRAAPDAPAAALAPPGCVNTSANARTLAGIRPSFVRLAGMPFAVTVTAGGQYSFVSTGVGRSIEVLHSAGTLAPAPVRRIMVPAAPHGEAITPDGQYLLAASGSGAVVISVARAEHHRQGAVLGTLTSPHGAGAVEVALSRDGQFAFVTLENSGTMAVFNLRAALASGLRTSGFVGDLRLGINPIGMSVSQDGQWLYVTTQKRTKTSEQGTLTMVSVPKAETSPAGAVQATVQAGCDPGRVITTAGGATVWVTARASNALLAFSAARLRTDPGRALIAKVEVGAAPIGLTALNGGSRILVANSGRHGTGRASLGVIDTAAALRGRPAVLGLIQAGLLPREFAVEPGGRTALVTNSVSHQLEAVNVSSLR
jgi:serine/threonine protein kinase/DNA-binding beta-propeller fold protein YncE